MRAHFAGDVTISADSVDTPLTPEQESLEARIDDFKRDPKNMAALTEFIDGVLEKAKAEAEAVTTTRDGAAAGGSGSQQQKEKSRQSFSMQDLKNGKVVNRARGLVVRLFDAICNCANTAAAPAQRIKLRGKRAASVASTEAGQERSETKEKNKKQEEKKHDKRSNNSDKKKDEQQQQSAMKSEKSSTGGGKRVGIKSDPDCDIEVDEGQ